MVRKMTRKKPDTSLKRKEQEQKTDPKETSAYNQGSGYKLYGYEDSQIPTMMREPFVVSKYRFPGLTAGQCVCSIFQLNNEIVDIWSHLIGLAVFVIHVYSLIKTISLFQEPFAHPLLYVVLGSCTMLLVSACAHTFNSMSPYIYHICYFFDYASISFGAFSLSQGVYFYSRPLNTPFQIFNSPETYLCLSLLNSFILNFTFCAMLVKRPWYDTFVRSIAFISLSFFTALPYFTRLALCSIQPTSGCPVDSIPHFKLVCIYLSVGGFVYAFRIPERWIPRIFDILGHSHNIFHVFYALGILQFFTAIHAEMVQRKKELLLQPLAWAELSGVFCLLAAVLNFGFVFWFSHRLYSRQTKFKH